MASIDTILLVGRPGSGKGTQGKLLADELGAAWLSSGERFKELRDSETPLGRRVRAAYDQGHLMPDWFADYLLEDALLALPEGKPAVLDGFGRTERQAEHLMGVLAWLGRSLTVLNLEVGEDEATRRMLLRAGEEHRPDSDDETKVDARFAVFRAETEPALARFRAAGVLKELDGERTPEEVRNQVRTALELA
jgi:adenylate kinase